MDEIESDEIDAGEEEDSNKREDYNHEDNYHYIKLIPNSKHKIIFKMRAPKYTILGPNLIL